MLADDPLLCGIDAGTTRIRAIVFEAAGGGVVAEGSAPTPTRHPGPGLGEHDAEELWRATVTALRAAVAGVERPARIRSVAVGSMGEAGVLLDRAGLPLAPVLAWYDGRPGAELARLERRVGREVLHRVTGLCPDPTFTLLKLLWLRAELPEAFAAATSWLGVSGWLAWRLCGARATDASLASRTLLLDLAAGRWSGEILAAADLRASLLGEITPAGTGLGRVLPEAATATGLPGDCIVGVGAHDHVSGLLALGADEPGVLLDSIGTAEALTLVVPAPSRSAELLRAGVNQGRVEAGGGPALFYLFGGLPTCSAAVEWFRGLWPDGPDHATLIAEAEAVPVAEREVLFLPQLRLGSPPFPDPVARGAFLGLSDKTSRGAMFRALLEGLALDTANQLGLMREHAGGGGLSRVVATGGGTRNRLLTRLKASVYGAPAEAAEMPETTCLVPRCWAGWRPGIFPDLPAGRRGLVATRRALEPEPGWGEAERALRLAAYRRAYAAARDIHALVRGAPEPG
jgi:xylulokinase